mmetsp:Transcript_58677/g.157119  ORF Transcript_58677/g.157119 Transcript_58677/m.157119 type:complete len:381 (+) Transcript_58677:42-1184(+)
MVRRPSPWEAGRRSVRLDAGTLEDLLHPWVGVAGVARLRTLNLHRQRGQGASRLDGRREGDVGLGGQDVRHGAHERIARARGVDHLLLLDLGARDGRGALGRADQGALGAHGDQDLLASLCHQGLRRLCRLLLVRAGQPCQQLRLALVGADEVRQLVDLVWKRDCWRGREHAERRLLSFLRQPEGLQGAVQGRLELRQDDLRPLEDVLGVHDVLLGDAAVGPRHDDDVVLPAPHADLRHARGLRLALHGLGRVPHVHAQVPEVLQGVLAEGVAADLPDHGRLGAEPRGHDRLVGALAAEEDLELRAVQGLPLLRQTRSKGHEVRVAGADHDHIRRAGWSSFFISLLAAAPAGLGLGGCLSPRLEAPHPWIRVDGCAGDFV